MSLGVKKGPGMKDVMDNVRNWMVLHPHGSKEECIRDVIQKNESLRVWWKQISQ